MQGKGACNESRALKYKRTFSICPLTVVQQERSGDSKYIVAKVLYASRLYVLHTVSVRVVHIAVFYVGEVYAGVRERFVVTVVCVSHNQVFLEDIL